MISIWDLYRRDGKVRSEKDRSEYNPVSIRTYSRLFDEFFYALRKKLFDKSENTGYRKTNLNYEVLEWIVIGKKVWKKN